MPQVPIMRHFWFCRWDLALLLAFTSYVMFFFTPISGSSLIYMCWPAYCLKITNCIQVFRDVSLCSSLLSVFQNLHSSHLCFQSSTIVSSVYRHCKTAQVPAWLHCILETLRATTLGKNKTHFLCFPAPMTTVPCCLISRIL